MIATIQDAVSGAGGVVGYCTRSGGVEQPAGIEDLAGKGERVQWTETRNLSTDRPDQAARIMEATIRDASELKRLSGITAGGRKLTKPLTHYTLSWAEDEDPSREEMRRAVDESMAVLGLEDRQAVVAAHGDTDHPHVHVIVNRVSPEDGRAAKLGNCKLKLSKWANGFERSQGRIRCPARAAAWRLRDQGRFVRGKKRIGRRRWEREWKDVGRIERLDVPRQIAGRTLTVIERADWGRADDSAARAAGGKLGESLRELSTANGREWRELYDRQAAEKAGLDEATATAKRRFQRWVQSGARLSDAPAVLRQGAALWVREREALEQRHKTGRVMLGRQHHRETMAAQREAQDLYAETAVREIRRSGPRWVRERSRGGPSR